MDNAQILQQAIAAIKSGDKVTGQKLLLSLVKADPNHETALLWLSVTTDDITKKRQCFERVLAINPNNQTAKRGLAELQQKQVSQLKKPEITRVEAPSQQTGQLLNTNPVTLARPSQSTTPQSIGGLEEKEPLNLVDKLSPEQFISSKSLKPLNRKATKKCPYCAETIKAGASVCRFCGQELSPSQQPKQSQPAKKKIKSSSKGSKLALVILLGIFGGFVGLCVIISLVISSAGSPQQKSSQENPRQQTTSSDKSQTQTMTTSEGDNFTVPGDIAYTDGRTRSGSSTTMTLGVWNGVPRQKVVCRLPHGTKIKLLEAKWVNEEWEYGDGRYYFLIDYEEGECNGWMPENFLSKEYGEPTGEKVP